MELGSYFLLRLFFRELKVKIDRIFDVSVYRLRLIALHELFRRPQVVEILSFIFLDRCGLSVISRFAQCFLFDYLLVLVLADDPELAVRW